MYEQIRDQSINLFTTLKDQRELVWNALGKKLLLDDEEDSFHLIEFCLQEKGLLLDNNRKVFKDTEIR